MRWRLLLLRKWSSADACSAWPKKSENEAGQKTEVPVGVPELVMGSWGCLEKKEYIMNHGDIQ